MTKMNAHDVNEKSIGIDAAIANTAIHDCDDSTYEVHVSAATQHMLAQLRENFITGLNIYSLIETTMLKYAESHATKDYLLVKSSQAYKQLSESTNKELVELRQLVEVLKKENEELRNELDGYRSKATVVKEPVTEEDVVVEVPVTEDDVENAPILVSAPDIEHSSEHTVTLSDEDVSNIRGSGIVEAIPPLVRDDSDEDGGNNNGHVKQSDLDSWVNGHQYKSRPMLTFPQDTHRSPNGAGNGVFVSTGKPDTDSNEKIRVTEYSKVANTRI